MLVAAALMAVANWRLGFFLCLLTGVLQDPLRKLAPDQPAYFVVFVGVVFGAAWLGASSKHVPLGPNHMEGWAQYMRKPFNLFIILVMAQALNSFVGYGSPVMTGIGLMVWLAPILAIVLAYQFAMRGGLEGVQRWMWFYCLLSMTALGGIYLEYNEFGWAALGEVGEGLFIYDLGGILKAYSGFFRSSEIAAWHSVTTSAFVFMLLTCRKLSFTQLLKAFAIMSVLVMLGTLTGRRKMMVEVVIFISAYFFLVTRFQRGAGRLALGVAVAGLLAWGAVVGLSDPDPVDAKTAIKTYQLDERNIYEGYTVRSQSVFDDVYNRFAELGIAPIGWAIDGYGWFGAGLGTGSQQGAGADAGRVLNSGAAEGGLGKITQELGVPGLLLMGWLVVAFARYLRWVLVETTRLSQTHARMAYGLIALLLAKGASFSVATQAYSDLFVLILMGCAMGFTLAMPVLAARSRAVLAVPETVPNFLPLRQMR